MNAYEAKFAREAKENPIHWVIFPNGRGTYRLVFIGPPRDYAAPIATVGRETNVPHLRVVK